MTVVQSILHWLYSIFRPCFNFRLFGGASNSANNNASAYATLDDDEEDTDSHAHTPYHSMYNETSKLLKLIHDQYGNVHPNFYTSGDFKSVTDLAKRQYKVLLVYLHSDDHQDTPDFCRNVLCTEAFKEYVDENFLFFGANVSSRGGFELSASLRATTFPFFAVIYVVQSQVNVVARLEGSDVLDLDSLMVRLMDAHDNALPQLVVQQTEDSDRSSTRRQIEEQDLAFKAALERDRQAAEEKQRREREEQMRIEQEERKQREKKERFERIQKQRSQMKANLAPEPDVPNAEMRKQGVSLIKFKLPNGSQLQRKFHKDDKIVRLYEFVHTLDSSMSSWVPNEKSDVTDYELTLNMPKKLLDPNSTLSESGCFPNAQVFVRETYYEEDEDEEITLA